MPKQKINSVMTQAEFSKYAQWFFLEKVMPTLNEKGAQYSTGRAFTNFEQGSELHDVTPGSYLMIMATKHWHNLCKHPEGNQEERIRDIIVYMLLLQAMYDESNRPVDQEEVKSFESHLSWVQKRLMEAGFVEPGLMISAEETQGETC